MNERNVRPTEDFQRADPRRWWGLGLLLLPMLVLATDLTVLFFAMPTISADLDPTASQALWIVHAYGFLIAGFLITMGRLSDRVGPRRLLMIGASAFAALSAVAAMSTSAETLIAARALMGVAGATLMPSLFSLLRVMFHDDDERRFAIAVMFSGFAVGGALGPLVGGGLLEFFAWGSVFLVNVPVLLAFVVLAPLVLPESEERSATAIDMWSVVFSVTGILAVVHGVQELTLAQEAGDGAWSRDLAFVALGAALLTLFVRRQQRIRTPLFDLALLTDRRVAASLGALLLVSIGVVGVFYLVTQLLQWVADLSALEAGLWTLPYIAVNVCGSLAAPLLARRLTTRAVVVTGLLVVAAGSAGVALVASSGSLPAVVAALSATGFGHGMAMALVSDLIISSAPLEQAGSAAAAQEVGGELGAALGIAAAGAIGLIAYRFSLGAADSVPAEHLTLAQASVHDGMQVATGVETGSPEFLDAVRDAVGSGVATYASVSGLIAAVAAALIVVGLRERRPTPQSTTSCTPAVETTGVQDAKD